MRADPAAEQDVAALLKDVPVDPAELADLMRDHCVLVLSDLSLPSTAPPLAAVAFRLDRAAGIAQLAGIGVRMQLRRQGLGRRLLTGAAASLLASAGFVAERDTAPTDPANGRSRLVLVL